MIARANARLLRYLQDPTQITAGGSDHAEALRFRVQAYARLVLAQQQQCAPLGALRALYKKRDQSLSGLALKLMGDAHRSQLAIMQAVSLTRSDYGWYGDYGSTVRDQAMMIALLAENQLQPDLQNNLFVVTVKRAQRQTMVLDPGK